MSSRPDTINVLCGRDHHKYCPGLYYNKIEEGEQACMCGCHQLEPTPAALRTPRSCSPQVASEDVKKILQSASTILTNNFITHIKHLEEDFWCIEVSTVGFERHAAISLRDLLNNILDKLDVSVEFTGACFMVTWYHKTREPTFPKDVCYICNKEIKDEPYTYSANIDGEVEKMWHEKCP